MDPMLGIFSTRCVVPQVWSADVVIQIPPERVRDQDGYYRLDYWPPQGIPQPNTTFTPSQVVAGVKLTRALPGTKYDFQLYYTNATINDYPTWTASITTGNASKLFVLFSLSVSFPCFKIVACYNGWQTSKRLECNYFKQLKFGETRVGSSSMVDGFSPLLHRGSEGNM